MELNQEATQWVRGKVVMEIMSICKLILDDDPARGLKRIHPRPINPQDNPEFDKLKFLVKNFQFVDLSDMLENLKLMNGVPNTIGYYKEYISMAIKDIRDEKIKQVTDGI